jgi:RNA polymerase sigma-70 factor (ECF subfamily)
MKPDEQPMATADIELIRQAQSGDLSAFEQLVRRYDRRVLTIAASYVQSSDDAKDIYQEVFLRVYRALPKFEMRSEFSTWLYRIATNVCLSHRSRARRHRHVSLEGEADEESDHPHPGRSNEPSIAPDVGRREIASRVREALSDLSPRQRLVFTMRHYEGYKLREIAEMMEVAEGSVKKYLFEATGRMRDQLGDLLDEAVS